MKLDKTQPYGEVSGAMECGTRYFQDDKRFDVNGDEITIEPAASTDPVDPVVPADPEAVKGKPGRKPKADPVAAADVDEQLAAQLKAD